jgi:hypothetical protein
LSEGIVGSGPAHFTKLTFFAVGLVLLVAYLSARVLREPALVEEDVELYTQRATLGAAVVIGFVVLAGAFLERLPSNATRKEGPEFREVRPIRPGSEIELGAEGRFHFERSGVWVQGSSSARFFVSSPEPVPGLKITLTSTPRPNQVLLKPRRRAPVIVDLLPRDRQVVSLPLSNPFVFRGPHGERFIYAVLVRSRAGFVPADAGESRDRRNLGCYLIFR